MISRSAGSEFYLSLTFNDSQYGDTISFKLEHINTVVFGGEYFLSLQPEGTKTDTVSQHGSIIRVVKNSNQTLATQIPSLAKLCASSSTTASFRST